MRKRIAAILAGLAMLAPAMASAQEIETHSNYAWRDTTAAICLRWGANALESARQPFGFGAVEIRRDTWYVDIFLNDVVAVVYCIGDPGTGAVAAPTAKRILVGVEIATTIPEYGDRLLDFIVACMEDGYCPALASPNARNITWTDNATADRGPNGELFTYVCPALAADTAIPSIWGTDVYTDDSPICAAALHAGEITRDGGWVTIEILSGRDAYVGSTRNGVTSWQWGAYSGSYRIVPADG